MTQDNKRKDEKGGHPSGHVRDDSEKKREQLKSLSGKIQINLDREKREAVELAHQKRINTF